MWFQKSRQCVDPRGPGQAGFLCRGLQWGAGTGLVSHGRGVRARVGNSRLFGAAAGRLSLLRWPCWPVLGGGHHIAGYFIFFVGVRRKTTYVMFTGRTHPSGVRSMQKWGVVSWGCPQEEALVEGGRHLSLPSYEASSCHHTLCAHTGMHTNTHSTRKAPPT